MSSIHVPAVITHRIYVVTSGIGVSRWYSWSPSATFLKTFVTGHKIEEAGADALVRGLKYNTSICLLVAGHMSTFMNSEYC